MTAETHIETAAENGGRHQKVTAAVNTIPSVQSRGSVQRQKTDSTGGTERSDDPVLFSQGDIVYEFFEFFLSDSFYPEQIFRRLE